MSKSQQKKGRNAELELSKILQAHGIPAEPGQAVSYGSTPDIMGVNGIHVECKRHERLEIPAWLRQARSDADRFGGIPAVFFRQNRQEWAVVMDLLSWLELYRSYHPPRDSNHGG